MAQCSSRDSSEKKYQVELNSNFTKDSLYCYFRQNEISGSDAPTFEALDENYARDKDSVYFCDSDLVSTGRLLPPFRTQITIKTINEAKSSEFKAIGFLYGKDSQHGFFKGEPFLVNDLQTLIGLGRDFARDDQRVYFKGKMISGSNGKTFQFLDSAKETFAKDSKYCYCFSHAEVVKIFCHSATFVKIDNNYSKDAFAVYYYAVRLEGANPKTFEVLNHTYAKDEKSVFCQHLKIAGADPGTFAILPGNENLNQDYYYSADKNYVFWQDEKVKGADPKTFVVLERGYGIDKDHAYYQTSIVGGANPKTFKSTGGASATDGVNEFYEGKKTN